METTQIRCVHCNQTKRRNRRVKGQKYCGAGACQQARKNAWERNKLQTDASYKASRAASKRRWSQKDRQGSDYQCNYRQTHSEYLESNRVKQRIRGEKGKALAIATKIVKTDALGSQVLDKQGIVVIFVQQRTDGKKIVKTDALSSQVLDKRSLMQILWPDSG